MNIPKRNRPISDLTGYVFSDLTVLQYAGSLHGNSRWKCFCKCGNTKTVIGGHLTSGHTKSCGCLSVRKLVARSKTHGATARGNKWREYGVWRAMLDRCSNPKNKHYNDYGGRGISVCERWKSSFENFLSDMGGRFADGMTIERDDVNGNYYPENCRLATSLEQSQNKRNSHFLLFRGKSQCVSAWARELGIQAGTIYVRINKLGWSVDMALSTPAKRGNNQYATPQCVEV